MGQPSIMLPLRRLSQNLEQAVSNFLTSEKIETPISKSDHIKSKIDEVLDDKEEIKKFKEFARKNYVTTNIGVQELLQSYADSKDEEYTEQTGYLIKDKLAKKMQQRFCSQYHFF